MLLWWKIPWWKWKCETVRWSEATASFFIAKVWGEAFAHFHEVAVKRHSTMCNWLFGLPGRILSEQSPWCERKLWACSWLCYAPVSHYSVSVSLDFPCTVHAFFPEGLSNLCQGLRLNFSEICTKLYAYSLSDPLRNRIRSDTRLQIKGRNKSADTLSWVNFRILTPKIG
jgi:hypothetical protein